MIVYFLMFTVAGSVMALASLSVRQAAIVSVLIALLWAFVYGLGWALVSLAELSLGYTLVSLFRRKETGE